VEGRLENEGLDSNGKKRQWLNNVRFWNLPRGTQEIKEKHVGFEVSTAVVMKSIIFWDMILFKEKYVGIFGIPAENRTGHLLYTYQKR
jgi:hypothetical protein